MRTSGQRLLLLLACVTTSLSQNAEATHFRFGNLSWEPTGVANEVEFHLTVAYRRDYDFFGTGLNPPSGTDGRQITGDTFSHATIDFGDGTPAKTLRFIVTSYSITEDFIIGEVLDLDDPTWTKRGLRHTYASGRSYTAFFASSARISGLNNRGDGDYRLQTTIQLNGNHSPRTTLVPTVVVPESANASILIPATDPDGNSLRFRVAQPLEVGGGDSPPNFSINATTGLVTWDTRGLDQTQFWTAQIIIEDLDAAGTAKTQTPVDFLLKISGSSPNVLPTGTLSPPGPYSANVGQPFAFTVTGKDTDVASTVTINSGGLPPGAATSPALPAAGPGTGTAVTFNWTPTSAQLGTHPIVFSITDEIGAQFLVQTSIVVTANAPPTATLIPPGPFTINTGEPLSFTLAGSDPDTGSELTIDAHLPAGATAAPALPAIGPGTGTAVNFDWTPTSTQAGTYPVSFTVTDDQGTGVLVNTNITVIFQAPPVGSFSGFIADARGHAGSMTLRVGRDGKLTGSLALTLVGNFAIKSGQMDDNNRFSLSLPHGVMIHGVTVAGNLRIEIINGTDVYDGTLIAPAPRRPASAGAYTMLLPPDSARLSDPLVPHSTGYAVGFADATGRIRFVGATGDGKKFGTGSGIRSDATVPFFAKLDPGRSSRLRGVLTFAEKTGSDFDGVLAWVKPPALADTFYPRGFAVSIDAIGSRYTKPAKQTGMLPLGTGRTLMVDFTEGNLPLPWHGTATIPDVGDPVVIRPLRSLTMIKSSGLLNGYFVHQSGLSKYYQGIVFQKQNRGEGFFLGTDKSGKVTVAP